MHEFLFTFCFFSLPNIFTLVAASISPLLTAAMTFSCVSSSLYTKVTFFSFRQSARRERARSARKKNEYFLLPPTPTRLH